MYLYLFTYVKRPSTPSTQYVFCSFQQVSAVSFKSMNVGLVLAKMVPCALISSMSFYVFAILVGQVYFVIRI